ncbi:MAG: calcium-binding protein, partial [Chthoniobacteraceae bacterium]
ENVSIDASTGADTVQIDSLVGAGINNVKVDFGKQAVQIGTKSRTLNTHNTATTSDDDVLVEPVFSYRDDLATDTLLIKGDDNSNDTFTLSTSDSGVEVKRLGSYLVTAANSVRGENDTVIVDSSSGNDRLDAGGVTEDKAVLKLMAGNGDDELIGSPFDDTLDGGSDNGNDRFTGGMGHDTFIDEGGDDTLIERQNADFGLFGNYLVIGKVVGDGRITIITKTHYTANEVQLISVTPGATAFKLTFNNVQTTDINPATATAADLKAALEALAEINSVNVTGSGTVEDPWKVQFVSIASTINGIPELTGPEDKVSIATKTQRTINAVQQVSHNATAGTFTLTYAGKTTAPLSWNASALQVQTALRAALATVANPNAGNYISVLGTVGNWTVSFASTGDTFNVPELVADSSKMVGGGVFFKANTSDEQTEQQRLIDAEDPDYLALGAPVSFPLRDGGDTWSGSSIIESTLNPSNRKTIFEHAILVGGDANNVMVVNDVDGVIRVGVSPFDVTAFSGTVSLDNQGVAIGAEGGLNEYYIINLTNVNSARITIDDSGGTLGFDELVANGTNGPDTVTLDAFGSGTSRVGTVTVGDRARATSDILSYRGIDRVRVNGLAGADDFLSNDTVVYTVIDLGSGDDNIAIATVPLKPDTGNRTLEFPDGVPVVDTDNLTNGNSAPLTILGGDQNDRFEVNHNRAKLYLDGGNGNDRFLLKTFLVLRENPEDENEITNLTTLFGGGGDNRYDYLQNAPVKINGGPGTDTIVLVGTPIGDTFVVTDTYIAGAGRVVNFTNIEAIEVDGGGGPDNIYVLATSPAFETTVVGGSGDDTIHVGGQPPTLVFDPPSFEYQPPTFRIQLPPDVVYSPRTDNLGGLTVRVNIFNTLVTGTSIQNVVQNYLNTYALVLENAVRAANPYARFDANLANVLTYTPSALTSRLVFGTFFIFDAAVEITIPDLAFHYEIGALVPREQVVTPAKVTVDPPPFAFKATGIFDVSRIRGRLIVQGGDQFETAGDRLIIHNQKGLSAAGQIRVRSNIPRLIEVGVDDQGNSVFRQDRDENGVLLFDEFQSIEGIGLATGQSANGLPFFGIDAQGFETLELRLADGRDPLSTNSVLNGNDEFTIIKTYSPTNTQPGQKVLIVGGAGNDRINLGQLGGVTTIYGGAGNDTVDVRDRFVQTISTTATSGSFSLTFGVQTTAPIAYNATAAQVQAALAALSNIPDTGGVAVTGTGTLADPWVVTFGTISSSVMGVPILTASSSAVTINAGGLFVRDRFLETISTTATSGTFTITYDGQTTAPIAFDAKATAVQAALAALSNVPDTDGVVVTGTGTLTDPWKAIFTTASTFVTGVPTVTATGSGVTVRGERLGNILNQVYFDGDAHIDENVVNVSATNPDFTELLRNAPLIYINTTPTFDANGHITGYAAAQQAPIVFDTSNPTYASLFPDPLDKHKIAAFVVQVDKRGNIIEDPVQLVNVGGQRLYYSDDAATQVTSATHPPSLDGMGVQKRNGSNQLLYLLDNGLETTTRDRPPVLLNVPRVAPVLVTRVTDILTATAGDDTVYLDNSSFSTGDNLVFDSYLRAVDKIVGGRAQNHGTDKFAVAATDTSLTAPLRAGTSLNDVRFQVVVGGVTRGLFPSEYSYNSGTNAITVNVAGLVNSLGARADAVVEISYLNYYAVADRQTYLGGETVVDPFTGEALRHRAGDLVFDVYTRAQLFDINGNPLTHAEGDLVRHFLGEPVVRGAGDLVRYLGGEATYEEPVREAFTRSSLPANTVLTLATDLDASSIVAVNVLSAGQTIALNATQFSVNTANNTVTILANFGGSVKVDVAITEPVLNPGNRESFKDMPLAVATTYALSTDINSRDAISVSVVKDGVRTSLAPGEFSIDLVNNTVRVTRTFTGNVRVDIDIISPFLHQAGQAAIHNRGDRVVEPFGAVFDLTSLSAATTLNLPVQNLNKNDIVSITVTSPGATFVLPRDEFELAGSQLTFTNLKPGSAVSVTPNTGEQVTIKVVLAKSFAWNGTGVFDLGSFRTLQPGDQVIATITNGANIYNLTPTLNGNIATVTPVAVNEVQNVRISAIGGTFTLTFRESAGGAAKVTAPIDYNAGAVAVEAALDALLLGNGQHLNVAVTGNGTADLPWRIEFLNPAQVDLPTLESAIAGGSVGVQSEVNGGPAATSVRFTIAVQGVHRAGETKLYDGSELVQLGQPILAQEGGQWNFVLDDAGKPKVYVADKREAAAPAGDSIVIGSPSNSVTTLTLSGPVRSGDTWSFTLNDLKYEVKIPGSTTLDDLNELAAAFAATLDDVKGYDATSSGAVVTITKRPVFHGRGEPVYVSNGNGGFAKDTYAGGEPAFYIGNEPLTYLGGEAVFYSATDTVQVPAVQHRVDGSILPNDAAINFVGTDNVVIKLGNASNHFTMVPGIGPVPGLLPAFTSFTGNTTVTTGAAVDIFDIRRMAGVTTIFAGGNDDIVNVGSQAGLNNNQLGVLNGITAQLNVNGEAGNDVINVDDDRDDNLVGGVQTSGFGALTHTFLTDQFGKQGFFGVGGRLQYLTAEFLYIALGLGSDSLFIGSTADAAVPGSASTLNGFPALVTIDANTQVGTTDTLKIFDSGDTTDNRFATRGELTSDTLIGLGIAQSIVYQRFEAFNLVMGTGSDDLFIASTHAGVTIIDTGDEVAVTNGRNDIVNIGTTNGETTVRGGKGNDVVRVNYDRNGRQTFEDGIGQTLTIEGGEDNDLYEIGLSGKGSAKINVVDDENGTANDALVVYGTNSADTFLFRPHVIATLESDVNRTPIKGGNAEVVNYRGAFGGRITVYGRDGNDLFVFDDTNAPLTVYGDAGDDTFQVGQLFKSPRDVSNPYNGLLEDDYFPTTFTTKGYLSNGISSPAELHGGAGRDSFTVYHNRAELFLFGEEDDDTFRVRAFVKVDPKDPKKPFTNINGGQGADFIDYTVNAPVRIEGGDGFDTLTVVGTEFGDDFVITREGVFGAGLFITYSTIEKLTVDALEGNDTFFIVSTPENVILEVTGGLGTDTFNVAGGTNGKPITVVSKSLEGHSGLISQFISSLDGAYNDIFVSDLAVKISDNDAAGVAVRLTKGPLRVFEGGLAVGDPRSGLVTMQYEVVLTRAPEENVRITASPPRLTEEEQAAGGKGISLSTDPSAVGSEAGVTLLFDRTNWFKPQTIYVTAPEDAIAEGRRTLTIQHRAIQGGSADDGGAYDNLPLPGVTVDVIDNDSADVLIAQDGIETLVNEHPPTGPQPKNATDKYFVVLTKQPLNDVTVELNSDGQSEFFDGTNGSVVRTLTFTAANWFIPKEITVRAHDDNLKEGIHFSRLTHDITSLLSTYFGLLDSDVVAGLLATINGNADTLVTAAGLDANHPTLLSNQIELSGPAFKLNNGANVRTTFVNGDKAYTTAAVALTGAVADGVRWTLNLNGVDFSYIAKPGDQLAQIADGLKTAIGMTYSVTLTAGASDFSVTRTDGAAFSVALSRLVPTTGAVATSGGTLGGVRSADFYQRAVVSVDPSVGAIADGDLWSLSIDGTSYRYVAGAHKELRQPASLDVRIADDEAPSVLFSQSNGSTNVIEASDLVVLGGGFVTQTVTGKKYVQITTAGAAPAGDWKIFLNGSATASASYTSAAGASYVTIARELAGQLDDLANITARFSNLVSSGSNIIVLSIITDDGSALTVSVSVPAPAVSQFVSGFRGDFGTSIVREVGTHDSIFNAQDLELGRWSTNSNPDIANPTTPHLSVLGTGDGNSDFYRFRITDEMLKLPNGQPTAITAFFDIDHGFDTGDAIQWNSIIRLYDQDGRLIAQGPAGSNPFDTAQSGTGSTTFADDFLSFTFNTKGVYYLEIDNALGFGGLPTGVDYTLQVSVPNHPVAGFVFAPEAIGEVGLHDTIFNAQSVDPRATPASEPSGTNFFTFFDPNVGNKEFGGSITSTTPYVRVQGSGDGSFDVFQFEVTDAMLNPPSHTAFGTVLTPDSATYYKKVVLSLSGAAVDGDVWTLKGLRGRDYSYRVGDNPPIAGQPDTLMNIAQQLFAQLPARFLGFTTIGSTSSTSGVGGTALAPTLTIVDDAGFTFTGLSREIQHAGDVARTTKVLQSNGTTAATFSTVDISVANLTSGNGNAGKGDRWTLKLGAQTFFFDVPTTGTTTLESVAAGLAAKINTPAVGFTATNTVGTKLIHISTSGSDFGVEITVSGENPDGYATLTGTPTPGQRTTINWTSATFVINGPVRPGEDWKITLTTPGSTPTTNSTHYTAKTGDNEQDIATGLASNLTTGGYTATAKGTGTAADPYRVQIDRTAVFTTDFSLTASGTGTVASTPTSVLLALSGSAYQGEVWSITVGGTTTLGTYTVGSSAASQTLDAVIDDLVSDINTLTSDNYVARKEEGNRIVLTKTNGGTISATVDVTAPLSTITVANETDSANDGAKTVVISGVPHVGEIWTLDVDTHSYTVPNGTTATLAAYVKSLTDQVNAETGYTAVAVLAGAQWNIHIARLNGAEPGVSLTIAAATIDNQTPAASHAVTLLRAPQNGDVWTIDLSGVSALNDPTYTLSSPGGNLESLHAVALGLLADLPSGFTGSVTGDTITINKTSGTFTADAVNVSATASKAISNPQDVAYLTLAGTPHPGDTWAITIGTSALVVQVTTETQASEVASNFAEQINRLTGFVAGSQGGALSVIKTGAPDFTIVSTDLTVTPHFAPVGAISVFNASNFVDLSGPVVAGENWTVTIGSLAPITQSGATLQAVAENLATAINAVTGLKAQAVVVPTDGTKWRLYIGSAGNAPPIGSVTTSTNSAAGSFSAVATTPDTTLVTLTGNTTAGERWIIHVDGADRFVDIVSQTRSGVAAALNTVIDGITGYDATTQGLTGSNVIIITKQTGTFDLLRADGAIRPVDKFVAVPASTTPVDSVQMTLSVPANGAVNQGDRWTITLGTVVSFVDAGASETPATMAAKLADKVNTDSGAGFAAVAQGAVIYFSRIGTSFPANDPSLAVTLAATHGEVTISGTPKLIWDQEVTLRTTPDVIQPNDQWVITIGAQTISGPADADPTYAEVALALATDARNKGFTAPNPGADDVVHIRNSSGAPLALGNATRPLAVAHFTNSARLDSPDDPATVHYRDVSATLAGEFHSGDRWTLTLDNQTYYYEVPTNVLNANKKLSTIAQGFVDLINGGVAAKTLRDGGILAGETQSLYSLASSGKVQFSFRETSDAAAPVLTTAAVNYNATAAEVQAAFNALTLANGNQLSVSVAGAGTLGDPWQVTFLNPANKDVPLLTGKLLLADGTTAAGNPFHTATLDPNATIKVTDRQLSSGGTVDDPFRFDVSRGGSVHVVLDIDKSALVTDFPFFGLFGLTVSPTLELLNAAGDVIAADDIGRPGHQVIVDAGSGHDRDPFIDYEITRTGTYFVRVGSYFDFEAFDPTFAPFVPADFRGGVYPGQSYELNMSVENHPTNPNALALEGKILTIIDGTGRGQTAKITAYDPETRQFTLDRLWTTAPDATSQFEISYHIGEENYKDPYTLAPTTDSYTATLSLAPSAPVTLNIRPELTRTFNSEFSFDALLNNGRNEAVQVRTATNRTVVELHDTVVAGEVWTVMLTRANASRATHATELPETFSYVAQTGDSLATIAAALAQRIGATGQYKAVANLGAITITATAGAFFTEFTITRGGANVAATRNPSGGLTLAVLTLTGRTTVRTPTPEVWKLTLDGIDLNYQVNVGDTLTDIAAGLAAALKSTDYTVSAAGSVLTVKRVNDAAFSLAFTVTADRNGAQVFSVGPKNSAGQLTTATVEFLGRPTIGTTDPEIWKLIVDNTELRYAVKTGDTLDSVVAGLEAALRASTNLGALYNVTRNGTSLTLNRIDGAGFDTAVVVTPNHENSAIVTSQLLFAPSAWGSLSGVLNGAGAPGALAGAQDAYYVDTATNDTYIRAGDAWILLKRWNEEQTVFVEAIDDTVADGSDALVVPAPEERVNAIRGPLIINGNIGVAEDAFLNDPFRLPGETNFPLPDGRIITFTQTTGPRDSFTDIFALHTTPQFGERPGLDPRINTSLYNLTFLDGGASTTAIDLTAVSKNILTVDNRTPFSVNFTPSQFVTFSGVPTAATVGSINWLNVSVTLNGVPSNNERWDVTIGGQTYTIRTTTLADADLADVDALLARLVATSRDTLAQDLWDGFSVQSQNTLADVTATVAAKRAILVDELNRVLTNGASIYNSNRFALGQLKADTNALRTKVGRTADETILLNRLLLRDGFGTTAGSAIGDNTTTLLELANKLRAVLPAGYRFDFLNSVFGNRLIISRDDGAPFAFNFLVDGNSSIIPKIRGTPDQSQVGSIQWTQASWRYAAGAPANSTITYAGKTYSPVASTETDAVARLVDGLAKAINADPDPLRRAYLPSVTGDTITLKQPVVTAFTATVGSGLALTGLTAPLGDGFVPVSNPTPATLFDRAEFRVTAAQAEITVGRIFTVTLGGTPYTYAARAGDRAGDVLAGLSAAIPASYLPTIENGALIVKSVALGGSYFYAPVNLNTRVNEADQVDILNVFNGDSPADDIGVLTEDRITGLGMGGKAIVGEREFDGGITYSNLEVVNVRLGSGADNFTVESTHRGLTTISGAKGDDTITVKTILGHTVILGGDGDDTVHLLSDDLVIDQLSGMLVVDGQAGADVLNVHDNSSIAVLITDHAGILSVRQPLDLTVLAANGRYALRGLGFGLPLLDSAGITRFNGYADAMLNFSMHAVEIDQALEALFGVNNLIVTETRTTDTAVFSIVRDTLSNDSDTDPATKLDNVLLWTLTVRNVPVVPGNTGTLTGTSITGLNLFTLSEVQRFTVQAKSGKYVLRAPGYGDVTLDYTATAADVQTALRAVYRTVDLDVTAVRTTGDVTYTVTFARTTAGQDFGQLLWLPSSLSGTDLSNVGTLATSLRNTANPVVQVLRSFFSQATNDLIDNVTTPDATLRATLVDALNDVIGGGRLLYDQANFAGVTLRPETSALLSRNPGGSELSRLNRLLLTDAFATILDTQLVPNENASAIVTTSTLRDGSTVPGQGVTSQQVLNIDATAGYFRIGFRLDAAAVAAIQHGVALTRDGSFVIGRTYVPEIKANNTVWTAAIPFNADADLFRLYLDPILNPANSDLDLPHTHNFDAVRTAGAFVLTLEGAYRTLSIQPTDIDRAPTGFAALVGTLALPAQTLSINATGGTFRIGLELTPGVITFTAPIAYNASADAVLAALNPLVNPANASTPLTDAPQTANVAVTKQNNVYTITFQGQFANLRIDPVNVDGALLDLTLGTTSARGTATLSTQLEGIYYYDLATLNIDLSAGSDIFNIRGSAAGTITNVRGHDGDDRFYVSSQADRRQDNLVGYDHLKNVVGYNYLNGTLNDVKGTLNLDGGAGRQTLMISDEAATVGDTAVSITDTFTGVGLPNAEILVRGLAAGDITFGANQTDGNFANGITIWSGFGNDTIAIDGTLRRDGLRTVTTLNTGLGNDRITASLTAGEDDFFVLNTQGAYHNQPAATDNDFVDGRASTLPLIVFGGQGDDDITGGQGDDLLFGDRGQVIYRDGAVIVSALGHAGPGDFTDGTIRPATTAFTEYASVGGNDTIRGREGRDLIFGGAANDTLYGFDANLLTSDVQSDVLVGDSGMAQYRNGVLVTIETIAPSIGGNDTLHSSLGANVLIGGAANDTIHAGGDVPFDVALGDNARVTFDATTGLILRAETIDPTIGGADIIDGGDSSNVIFGGTDAGTGFDEITTLNPTARNYVIGDNGEVNFDLAGNLIRLLTNTPSVGGVDHITTGGASDLIAGGVGADVIHAGAGNDFVLGDNGIFEFAADGVNGSLDWFASTDPTEGGADMIFGEAGEDYLFGGTAGDIISGGLDHDVILGDHGRYDKALQINQNFVSIFTANGMGAG